MRKYKPASEAIMVRAIFALLLSMASLFAAEGLYEVNDDCCRGSHRLPIVDALMFFEDKEGRFDIDSVREQTFVKNESGVPSFGFTDSVYWFKTTIVPHNITGDHQWWLKIDYPLLDHIELYLFDEREQLLMQKKGGELEPFGTRELANRHFTFLLPSLKEQPVTLYVRVRTESAMQVPMVLHTSEDFIEYQQGFDLLTGFYYGVFLIIIFYNIVLFYYTREHNYILYLLFLGSFVLWQLTLDGLGIQYLWSGWPWMITHGGTFLMALLAFTSLWFGRSFLQTERYIPQMDRIIFILMVFSVIMTLVASVLPYGSVVSICASLAIVVPLLLLASGIMVLRKSYRPARFYVIGWSAFLLGSLFFALNKFNVISGFYLLNHAQQVGSAVQMIFLSWALADRVKLLQDEYVEKLNTLNQVLSNKVKVALGDAREKDQLLMQQSRLAAMGEMIEQIAHQWRQPLNTMALINQDLYFKIKFGQFESVDIDKVNESFNENLQYMSKTIDDFRNFYQSDKKLGVYDLEAIVDTALNLSEASLRYAKIGYAVKKEGEPRVYAIKNELIQVVMNLLKNSRDAITEKQVKGGMITITLKGDAESSTLLVEDNGGGIDPEIIERIFEPYFTTKASDQGTGIGLYMSKTIIEKNMEGRLEAYNTKEGAAFVVTLSANAPA